MQGDKEKDNVYKDNRSNLQIECHKQKPNHYEEFKQKNIINLSSNKSLQKTLKY
jgi:hypothetical protein